MRRGALFAAVCLAFLACETPKRVVAVRSKTPVDSLLSLGDSIYRQSTDSARRIWIAALTAARASHDSAGEARALTGLGQAARQLGDLAESRRLGEQALALKQQLGMKQDLFRSFNALGLLAWDEERLDDATVLLGQAIEAATVNGDTVSR